jgi:hypothetical protein
VAVGLRIIVAVGLGAIVEVGASGTDVAVGAEVVNAASIRKQALITGVNITVPLPTTIWRQNSRRFILIPPVQSDRAVCLLDRYTLRSGDQRADYLVGESCGG